MIKLDTSFDSKNSETSPNARRARWEQLMKSSKGKIDVQLAEQFLSDHYDTFDKKKEADSRTLCGHNDSNAHGESIFEWAPYFPGGAVQGKAMDSTQAAAMSFVARGGQDRKSVV